MSDVALGAGWWVAADGKWHPPELRPPGLQPEIVAAGPDATAPDGDGQHDGTGEIEAATTSTPAGAMDVTIAVGDIDGRQTEMDISASAMAPSAEAPTASVEPAHPVQSAAATPIAPVRLVDTVRPVRVPPGPPPLPPEVSPFPAPPRLDEFLASRGTADAVSDTSPEISVDEGSDGTEPVEPDVAVGVADSDTPIAGAVEGDGVLDFLADFAPAEPPGIEAPSTEFDQSAGVDAAAPMADSGFEHPVVAEAEAVVGAGLGDDLFDDEDDSLSIHSLIFGGEADAADPELDVADADTFEAQAPPVAEPAVDMVPEPGMVDPTPEPEAAAVPVVEAVPVIEAVPEPVQPVAVVHPVVPVEPVVEVEPEPEPVVADATASRQVAATAEPVAAGESEPAGEPELDDEPAADEPVAASANAGARPARAGSAARPARPVGARQAPLVKGGPEFKDIFKMAMNGNSLADSVQVKYDAGSERGRVTSGSPPADDDSKRRRRRKR